MIRVGKQQRRDDRIAAHVCHHVAQVRRRPLAERDPHAQTRPVAADLLGDSVRGDRGPRVGAAVRGKNENGWAHSECRPHSILPIALPPAAAGIGSVDGLRRARRTPDRRIAVEDKRIHQHVIGFDVVLDVLVGPRGQRVDLHQTKRRVEADQRRVRARRRLHPSQTR